MNTATARTRYSDPRGTAIGTGLPPAELWGVATRDPVEAFNPRTRKHDLAKHNTTRRGPAAVARRRAKRRAAAEGITLKAYLRREARGVGAGRAA